MFSKGSVKLDKDLMRRATEHARERGFASVDDFVADLIERDLKQVQSNEVKEKVVRKLKGLGYF